MTSSTSAKLTQRRVEDEVHRSGVVLSHILGVRAQKIAVRLFPSRSAYDKFRGHPTQDWEVASALDKTLYLLSPDVWSKESTHTPKELSRIIRHEVVHLYMDRVAGERLLPRWLSEGLANVLAGGNQPQFCYIEQGFTKKIDTPAGWDRHSNYDAYRTAYLFCSYLVQRYKLARILKLIRGLSFNYSYPRFAAAFKKSLGSNLEDVEREFLLSLP